MAGISEIRKCILCEVDVFRCWTDDLREFEGTHCYASELAGMMMSSGCLNALYDFSSGQGIRGDLPSSVNTYPFGTRTNEIFPEFIGLCSGEQKMSGLFRAIKKQLNYYISYSYEERDRKAITVFTDKWSSILFAKEEPRYLKAILNYNVTFNFYLVTDYGITRIPFMDKRQVDHFKRQFKGQKIEEALTLQEYLDEMHLDEMEYIVGQYDSFIPLQDHEDYIYHFNFRSLKYYFENAQGEHKAGRINSMYAFRFLRAATALHEAGGLKGTNRPTNYIYRKINLHEFSFDWYDNTGVEESSEVKNMLRALNALISTLK